MTAPTAPTGKNNASALPDPSTFHIPLSPAQRTEIINYLWVLHLSVDGIPSVSAMRAMSDQDLLTLYTHAFEIENVLGSPITGPSNPFSSITDLLKFLLDPVRVGEILVGVILIGVAVNAALKTGVSNRTVAQKSTRVVTSPHRAAFSGLTAGARKVGNMGPGANS